MSKRLFKLLMVSVLVVFLAGLFRPVSAEGIALGNGVTTGMSMDQVEKALSDTENSELKRWEGALFGLKACSQKGTGNLFFFSADTGELLYKIMHLNKNILSRLKKALEKGYGSPVIKKNSDGEPELYYIKGEEVYRIEPEYTSKAFRLLHGDRSLFNEVAEENGLKKWPEE